MFNLEKLTASILPSDPTRYQAISIRALEPFASEDVRPKDEWLALYVTADRLDEVCQQPETDLSAVHSDVMKGNLGQYAGMTILTDAYAHPLYRTGMPTGIYVLLKPTDE